MSYDSSYQENGESYLVADYNDSRMFLEPAAQHWVHQSATAASTADGSDIEYVDNPQISREVFSEHTPSYPPLDTSQTTSSLGDPYYSAPAAYGASSHSTADAGMAQGDRSTDSSLPRSVEGYAGYYTYRAESGYMAATNIPFTFSQLFPEAPFGALSNNQGSQDAMGETGVGSAAPYAHVQENDQAQPPWTVNHLPVDPGLHNYGARQSSISYGDVGRSELVCNVQEPLGMQSRTWGMVADPDTDLSGTDSTAHDFANSILDFQMDVDRQLSETIQAGQESVGMTSASEFRARLGISPDRGQSELRPYSQQSQYPQSQSAQPTLVTTASSTASIAASTQVLGCTSCGRLITGKHAKGNMRRHRQALHEDKKYLCEFGCGKGMTRKGFLKKHYKNCQLNKQP